MMTFGTVIGIIMGALPGMTATMTVAILISFTFGMEPIEGMMLLVGVYGGALFAGSIPAILIRTPGTPSAAATLMDGFPMSEQGKAGKGIGIATTASYLGGTIGLLLAIFVSRAVMEVAMSFGSAEVFALAVFGLTIIVSVSEGSVIKGLIAGLFGVLLSTVGLDPTQGYPRFTFGLRPLLGGIAFIPAMIGLFGFSQGLSMVEKTIKEENIKQEISNVVPSLTELKDILPTSIGSSLIGTFVGAIPGCGGDIASFVTYNEAKRWASDKETFGEGNIKGVAAAESGNNSSTAGALIPALTLGIPGDSVTAILIGALMVHGLRPGPMFFADEPVLGYGIFVGFLIVYALILVFGLAGARLWARLIKLPLNILWPIIIVLCVVGSFAMRSSMFDVWVMLTMGIIGYFMRKGGFPLAPIILGIILGPIAESNLRRAMIISGGNLNMFYTHPITLGLLIVSTLSLLHPLLRRLFRAIRENLTSE